MEESYFFHKIVTNYINVSLRFACKINRDATKRNVRQHLAICFFKFMRRWMNKNFRDLDYNNIS